MPIYNKYIEIIDVKLNFSAGDDYDYYYYYYDDEENENAIFEGRRII